MSEEEKQVLTEILNEVRKNNLLLQQQNELLRLQLKAYGLSQTDELSQQQSVNESAFVEQAPEIIGEDYEMPKSML